MRELNGFLIDKYNVHNFAPNIKSSICPLCSSSRKKKTDKCVTVHWDTGMAVCHHCNASIQMHTYKRKETPIIYKKPEWKNKTELSDKIVKFFEGRKISQNTLKLMKVSEGNEWMPQFKKEVQTIQFNYFVNNELVNIKYRGAKKSFKMHKDAEKVFYNLDNIRTEKECIIVEGEMDCLSFIETGLHNCVSIPNGFTIGSVNIDYLDNYYDWFDNKEKIYLSIDNDEAGQNGLKELVRRLGAERCYIVNLDDCKDANEYHIKYGGEKLRECIEHAELLPIEHVETIDDHFDELFDDYGKEDQRGYLTGMENLDNIFSTYTGQYIVVTGKPSSGKSNFVDQMCLGYAANYGWKIAYASPEQAPTKYLTDVLMQRVLGYKPKQHEKKTLKVQKIKHYIKKHFIYLKYDSYDLNSVLEKGRELVKRNGIKVLVIDPFNKVRLKESLSKNVNEYAIDYLNKIEEFCKKNDVLVFLVAHPRKPSVGEVKEYKPTFYDIKGGGEFYDMSPHGLCVHRHFEEGYTEVQVMKVKFRNLGENLASCHFAWNVNNGRYTVIDKQRFEEGYDVPYDNSFWLEEENEQPELIPDEMPVNNEFDLQGDPDCPF